MIDLHCHLLTGVDDGPRDDDESADLARALLDGGVTVAACTSHYRPDKQWRNSKDVVAQRHARLAELFLSRNIALPHVQAAEHYIDDEVFGDVSAPQSLFDARVVPYGSSKWLLVECPYQGPPADLFGLLYAIRRRGYRVLLAHLERFPYVCDDDDAVDRLLQAGHRIQVNLGSLAGVYHRDHKKAAERLLAKGQVSVLAGDCHRASDVKANIDNGLRAARRLVEDAVVQNLTVKNPAMILENASPDLLWP